MTQAGSVFPSRLAELRHRLEQETVRRPIGSTTSTLAKLADERDRQTAENQRRLRRALPRAAHRARPRLGSARRALVRGLRRDPTRLGQHDRPMRAAVSRLGDDRRTHLAAPDRIARRRSASAASTLDLAQHQERHSAGRAAAAAAHRDRRCRR